jgi:geranylgeranyl diphosphate synthase type II
MNLKAYLKEKAEVVNQALENYLAFESAPFELLAESMKYSLFAGGKRVRPVLCLAANEVLGGNPEGAMPFACALEMIHTYSLIHDDLPSMDNDDLRRGRATNHKIYGEAQAMLAGNSLLTLAYEVCLEAGKKGLVKPQIVVEILYDISRAIGIMGVMGGQSLDILWEGKDLTLDQVETVCNHKTGELIITSIRAGALAAEGSDEKVKALSDYGSAIGLAFQVADDILNITGDPEKLGKATGSDKDRGKTTFPAVLGLDGARKKARELLEQALTALSPFGDEAWMLRDLARYIVERDR